MRKTALVFCLFFSFVLSFGQIPVNNIIKPGIETMKNANGDPSNIRLESKEKGVIVVFSCNTCPLLLDHLISLVGKTNIMPYIVWRKIMISVCLINSNEAKRDGVDSFEEMKKHAEKQLLNVISFRRKLGAC